MGAIGETRREGRPKPQKTKMAKMGASSIEATKEAVVSLKLRLFVGGLGPTVGASDLQQRFAPLGTVHRIDLVEGKRGWDDEGALQRGFAYVDFEASSEASLRKLFSAYNGCKWRGGVLRVEKAKEHYMDRLRREWAEAEAEAAAKAKAAAELISQSHCSNSSNYAAISKTSGSNKMELQESIGEQGDEDEIAAQVAKERMRQLDLLSKLFPEDNGVAGDEEEKVVEIAKLRKYPMTPDINAKKRKHALESPSESLPKAPSSVHLNEDESGVASVLKSPRHESGALDGIGDQKRKNRRVNFAEEVDAFPIDSMDDMRAAIKNQQKGLSGILKDARPILKKSQGDFKEVDIDRDEDEDEDVVEDEEEEYYPSSRSPSPEVGLSDESKWQRLFKYASIKKGPELSKPSDGVFAGISLDDDEDEEEPAIAATETPQRDGVGSDGMFSGVLDEPEDGATELLLQNRLGSNAIDSIISKRKKLVEMPETKPDQGKVSSDDEYASENLHVTESDASSDSEMDSDLDSDSEEEDFVDAQSALQSLTPTPLNEATKANKWEKMFKSVGGPVAGAFSGSLDDADVPVKTRPPIKEQEMFESAAAANQTGSVSEAPTVSDKIIASVEEVATRQSSGEEDASTSSGDITNNDSVAKTRNNRITDPSGEEEDGADDQQEGMSGNLLPRFNMEQNETGPSFLEQTIGAQSSGDLQQDGDELGLSKPTDENTRWMQRATWKSLVGADGRVAFSLKQLIGEPETTKAKTEATAVPEQSFAFNFNFACPQPETSKAATSRPKSITTEKKAPKAEKMSKPGSSLEKNDKPDKVTQGEGGCSFMKSTNAEQEWRASKSELRLDSKAKHKAAVRTMKKMRGAGGAR